MICHCCKNKTVPTGYVDEFCQQNLHFCQSCGHLQVAKVPDAKAMSDYYQGQYSQDRQSFIGERYFLLMKKRASAQANFIEAVTPLKNKSVCDLGCGYGLLISEMNHRGAKAFGLEFDPNCAKHCRKNKLNVDLITKESQISTVDKVDLVTMSHSLEHLTDFDNSLKVLKQKAKYLFIEVPAYDKNIAEQFDDQGGHINFFTEDSLKSFLTNRGYKIESIGRFGPSMSLFYRKRYRLLREILWRVHRDYFFNQYNRVNKSGIWIRAMAKPGTDSEYN